MSETKTTERRVTIQTDHGPQELVLSKTVEDYGTVSVTYRRDVEDHGTYQPPGRPVPRRPGKPSLRVID
jgi:hypothetical protein